MSLPQRKIYYITPFAKMQVFFYIFFKFFQPIIRKTITIINSYQN